MASITIRLPFLRDKREGQKTNLVKVLIQLLATSPKNYHINILYSPWIMNKINIPSISNQLIYPNKSLPMVGIPSPCLNPYSSICWLTSLVNEAYSKVKWTVVNGLLSSRQGCREVSVLHRTVSVPCWWYAYFNYSKLNWLEKSSSWENASQSFFRAKPLITRPNCFPVLFSGL